MTLIDRKKLLDELDEWERTETSNERALGVVDSKVIIAQMPTVDAIPVEFIESYAEDLEKSADSFEAFEYEHIASKKRSGAMVIKRMLKQWKIEQWAERKEE